MQAKMTKFMQAVNSTQMVKNKHWLSWHSVFKVDAYMAVPGPK